MSKIPHGEPYAGKLHVRFDEGADVPCGGVSPYSTPLGGSRERRISAKGSDPTEGFARDSDILSALLPRLVGRRKSPLGSHAVTHQFTSPCFCLASTLHKMLYYPTHMRHLFASLLPTREIQRTSRARSVV